MTIKTIQMTKLERSLSNPQQMVSNFPDRNLALWRREYRGVRRTRRYVKAILGKLRHATDMRYGAGDNPMNWAECYMICPKWKAHVM